MSSFATCRACGVTAPRQFRFVAFRKKSPDAEPRAPVEIALQVFAVPQFCRDWHDTLMLVITKRDQHVNHAPRRNASQVVGSWFRLRFLLIAVTDSLWTRLTRRLSDSGMIRLPAVTAKLQEGQQTEKENPEQAFHFLIPLKMSDKLPACRYSRMELVAKSTTSWQLVEHAHR